MRRGGRRPAPSAFDLACSWLARTPRSRPEIETRLRQVGFSAAAVAAAVERLVALGYVNDDDFARARARTLADRGYGDSWIAHDLGLRGLDGEVVARALATLDPEAARARAWLARRAPSGRGRSAWRALVRRGFDAHCLEDVLGGTSDGEGWGG